MASEVLNEYIEAKLVNGPPTMKTKTWRIINRRVGEPLATVKWNGAWRQYCLYPEGDTIWNDACLDSVRLFMRNETKLHFHLREEERKRTIRAGGIAISDGYDAQH